MKSLFLQVTGQVMACVFALALLANPVVAGPAVDIYKATTLVKNQSEAERNRAAKETLGEVVVRVSGQLAALNNPQVRAAINQAQNYLLGFSYNSTQAQLVEGDKVFPAMELQLNYSSQAIEQLLRKAELPLWPAQRPNVLVWPVVKDANGLRIETSADVLDALRQRANFRGVPLVFPKGDLKDLVVLPVRDLWDFNSGRIREASARYKADAILVARFTPTAMGRIPIASYEPSFEPDGAINSGGAMKQTQPPTSPTTDPAPAIEPSQGPWLGDWQLLRGDTHQGYTSETPELEGLLMQAADDLADEFAQQYAIIPSSRGAQNLYLHIGGITDFGTFKLSQAYLAGLTMVKKMDVVKVDADGLLVSLATEGDIKLLVTTLALGKKLQPVDPGAVTQVLNQANNSSVVSAAGEAALAAELDAEIAREMGSESAPLSTLGTGNNPLKYVWLH